MSFLTKIRQSIWLETINQSLYFRMPWGRRRQIVQELKANLAIASAEVGPEKALAQLGPAKELVASYLESEQRKFNVAAAILAVAYVFVFWMTLGFLIAVIAVETRDAIAPTSAFHHTYMGFAAVDIQQGERGGFSASVGGLIPTLSYPIAFLLAGRVWRLFPRKATATVASDE